MTQDEAIASVETRLASLDPPRDGDSWVVLPERTLERSFGWVVSWGSRLFTQTGELRFAVAGNAPFIVDRESGVVFETSTAFPIEHYIALHESRYVQLRT